MKKLFLLSFVVLTYGSLSANPDALHLPSEQTQASETFILAPEPMANASFQQEFNLHTNALFLAIATLNAGIEWRFKEDGSVLLQGGWAKWRWDNKHRKYQVWYIMPEYRWYFGNGNRWHLGAQAQYGELDFMLGSSGYQGDFYGGSAIIGYQLPVGSKLSLDFSLGFGFTQYKHDKYEWQNVAPVNKDVRVITDKDLKRNIIGPNYVGVNLVWHFTR